MEWLFDQPAGTTVFADAELLDRSERVFLVQRLPDGQWRFRHSRHMELGEASLVRSTLREMTELDPRILALTDLSPGHQAWDPQPHGSWRRGPSPQGPTFLIRFELTPGRCCLERSEVGAAMVNCWVRSESLDRAVERAKGDIVLEGWIVGNCEEACIIDQSWYVEDDEELEHFKQAQIDGAVYVFHVCASEEEDERKGDAAV